MNSTLVMAAMVGIVGALALRLRPRSHRQLDTRPRRVSTRRRPTRWSGRRVRDTATPAPEAVADWCDEIARRLRAGATLRECLQLVPPTDPATRTCTANLRLALDRGRATSDALDDHDPPDSTHLALAYSVMRTAADHGGPAAIAVDHTAAVLRQRAADREERLAQAAQARLSAHVLTAVPIAMLLVLVATDGDVRTVIGTPLGIATIGIGLLLNTGGWCWMRRIVGATR